MNILALLQTLSPILSKTDIHRMRWIIQSMLSMTGRVTMLGISRWTGKGGSYRTVQRFFNTSIPWLQVFFLFFKQYLFDVKLEYLLAGDESVITKSGKLTFGLDRFYAGLLKKVVKSIAIFSLSIISVQERRSYPLQVMQVVRTSEEKAGHTNTGTPTHPKCNQKTDSYSSTSGSNSSYCLRWTFWEQ